MDSGRLQLTSIMNFRDIGGYATGDGRRVRRGAIYRAGDSARLSEDDSRTVRGREVDSPSVWVSPLSPALNAAP